MGFAELRERWLPDILKLIQDVVRGDSPDGSTLVQMTDYHFGTGGKRLRAILPLMVAEAFEVEPGRLVPFGAACEMLHNATLVHDDLQDGDEVRRGRKTVWAEFGEPQAINLGDAMFYYSVLLCQRLDFPAEARERASRRLLVDTLQVIDGQEREFALKTLPNPTLSDYFRMVEGKTSGLFALPSAGAAELCDAPRDVVDGIAEAARHMGVLFQIQDDTLDLYGDKGRDIAGSDVGEGKRSALVAHALENATPKDAAWLTGVLDKDRERTTAEDVSQVKSLFERTGSLQFALDEMASRKQRAMSIPALASYPALRDLLGGMCDKFLEPIQPLLASRSAEARPPA